MQNLATKQTTNSIDLVLNYNLKTALRQNIPGQMIPVCLMPDVCSPVCLIPSMFVPQDVLSPVCLIPSMFNPQCVCSQDVLSLISDFEIKQVIYIRCQECKEQDFSSKSICPYYHNVVNL